MDIVSRPDGPVPSKLGRTEHRTRPTANDERIGPPQWQRSMREAIRCPIDLCEQLGLGSDVAIAAGESTAGFSVFVPREYLGRIRPGDINDPLLRQVLPTADESDADGDSAPPPGYSKDPVGDHSARLRPGLIRKYHGRALLIVTGACAVHCRYCFRRHYPYGDAPKSIEQWQPALDEIASDDSIQEVLLSGGDPLTMTDSRLAVLADAIRTVPHVRRLRVHTRLPIMIPSRVNDALIDWLWTDSRPTIVVVHANHSREIDKEVGRAFRRLLDGGIMLLNQSVLLRGVNDSVDALADLSERLVDVGVVPYYLHQLDRVAGASHFEVPVSEGRQLVASMRARLPGYAVPRYVREIAGQAGKMEL